MVARKQRRKTQEVARGRYTAKDMFPVTYFLLKFSPLSKLEPAVGDLSFHP
jgi:hypothetical protein